MRFNGQLLKDARKARGMSQEDLARAAGTTTSTITRMEREVHEPYSRTATKIAAALGINPESLYTNDSSDVPA